MTKSPTASQIVRALVTLSPPKSRYVYNDKTSFGHSIKVHGWSKEQTETAAKFLKERGFDVKVKTLTYGADYCGNYGFSAGAHTVHRLHVYDAA